MDRMGNDSAGNESRAYNVGHLEQVIRSGDSIHLVLPSMTLGILSRDIEADMGDTDGDSQVQPHEQQRLQQRIVVAKVAAAWRPLALHLRRLAHDIEDVLSTMERECDRGGGAMNVMPTPHDRTHGRTTLAAMGQPPGTQNGRDQSSARSLSLLVQDAGGSSRSAPYTPAQSRRPALDFATPPSDTTRHHAQERRMSSKEPGNKKSGQEDGITAELDKLLQAAGG